MTLLSAAQEATRSESVILRPAAVLGVMVGSVVVLLVLIVRLVRGADVRRGERRGLVLSVFKPSSKSRTLEGTGS